MDPVLVDFLKTSPAIGALLGLAYLCARWMERTQQRCHEQLDGLITRYDEQSKRSTDTSERLHEVLGEVSTQLERCARSHEELARARER